MPIRRLIPVVAALAFAAPAAAQNQAVNAVKPLYEQVRGWLIQSAEMFPEENYSFKPTPEVRSFGQIIGHVANASYMFCSTISGTESPSKQDAEKLMSKAELVGALKAAFAYCDKAYVMSDSKATERVTLLGTENTRLWAMAFNVSHDSEHYGNLVTYMRLKGMVPPSSTQSGG